MDFALFDFISAGYTAEFLFPQLSQKERGAELYTNARYTWQYTVITNQPWRTSRGFRIQGSSNLVKGLVTNPGGYLDRPPPRNPEKDPVTNPGGYLEFLLSPLLFQGPEDFEITNVDCI